MRLLLESTRSRSAQSSIVNRGSWIMNHESRSSALVCLLRSSAACVSYQKTPMQPPSFEILSKKVAKPRLLTIAAEKIFYSTLYSAINHPPKALLSCLCSLIFPACESLEQPRNVQIRASTSQMTPDCRATVIVFTIVLHHRYDSTCSPPHLVRLERVIRRRRAAQRVLPSASASRFSPISLPSPSTATHPPSCSALLHH